MVGIHCVQALKAMLALAGGDLEQAALICGQNGRWSSIRRSFGKTKLCRCLQALLTCRKRCARQPLQYLNALPKCAGAGL